jgi:hypothetical protein
VGQQEAGPARAGLFVFGGLGGIAADMSRSGCGGLFEQGNKTRMRWKDKLLSDLRVK